MGNDIKRDGRTLDHKVLEHLRITAVERVRSGEKPSAVMKSLGLCRTTIYPWLRAASKKGLGVLQSKKACGPKSLLGIRKQRELRRLILKGDPRCYGFEESLWSLRIIAALVLERFGVSMSRVSISALLRKLRITPRKPLRRAYERDPAAVEKWKRTDLPRLVKRAKRRNAVLLFLDEAGIQSDAPLGTTWGDKGKKTTVTTSGQRQKVNAVSAVSPTGEFKYQLYTCRMNATFFVEVLKNMVRGMQRPCFFVVDGHPSHKAKIVKDYIASTEGKVELHFIPPYAPDLNPDEFVWNQIKTHGLSKRPLRRNESLYERVKSDLDAIRKQPRLVRSFFWQSV
jgi:transposase